MKHIRILFFLILLRIPVFCQTPFGNEIIHGQTGGHRLWYQWEKERQKQIVFSYDLPYHLKALSTRLLYYERPLTKNRLQLGLLQSGTEHYGRWEAWIGVDRPLQQRVHLRIQMGVQQMVHAEGSAPMDVAATAQMLFNINRTNRIGMGLAVSGFQYGNALSVGWIHHPDPSWNLIVELSCPNKQPGFLVAALQYTLLEDFCFSVAWHSLGQQPSGGLSWICHPFKLQYNCRIHPSLGFSSNATFIYFLGSKKRMQ